MILLVSLYKQYLKQHKVINYGKFNQIKTITQYL